MKLRSKKSRAPVAKPLPPRNLLTTEKLRNLFSSYEELCDLFSSYEELDEVVVVQEREGGGDVGRREIT